MGTYDVFRMPGVQMPDGRFYAEDFQTKSLDCRLDIYTVTPDGRLMFQEDEESRLRPVTKAFSCYLRGPIDVEATFAGGRLLTLEIL